MRKKIILFIAWLFGIKREINGDFHAILKPNQLIVTNEVIEKYKNDILKLKRDLLDIIEAEIEKPEVKEEIEYVTQELNSITIKSETIVTELNGDEDMESLNDLLIKLLPYINKTIETGIFKDVSEKDSFKIINQITILTNKE